ncbi:transglycosylase domain-containing protein [Pragia fontium]|uniref:transglycosylase domain-containing protein n=1 Tax=Pragia fontium TaxID=82985 RepID=UPI00064B385E|nr:transglycosylase domain-containing protein [Pragia fontium]AKJ42043.1 hypothetical protein QQ39_08055 [Pragia fontium]
MKRFMAWLMTIFFSILLIAVLSFISYYVVEIYPARDELNASAAKYVNDKSQTVLLNRLMSATYPDDHYYHHVTRIMSYKYLSGQRQTTLRRITREGLWSLWLKMLYSREEMGSIWLSHIYLGRTDDNNAIYGIENGAGSLFSTALSDLSCEQLAELIIIPQSPSYYKLGSERLSARTKRLLPVCGDYEQPK